MIDYAQCLERYGDQLRNWPLWLWPFALLAPMVLRKLGMLGTADSRLMFRTMLTETLEFIQEATEAAHPPV